MELGILGDPGAPAISTQGRRKEQDIATTQPLEMVGPTVLVLQVMKLPVQLLEFGVHGGPGAHAVSLQEGREE